MRFERKHAYLLIAVAVWNVVTFGNFAKNLVQAAQDAPEHRWIPTATYRMGAAAAPGDAAAGAEAIVAGGNLAATFSYGDITQGGRRHGFFTSDP